MPGAFTAAILPQLAQCTASAARLIRANTFLNAQPTPMADGFSVVKTVAEGLYPCLGITCREVGGMFKDGVRIVGFEPCEDAPVVSPGDDALPDWGKRTARVALHVPTTAVAGL